MDAVAFLNHVKARNSSVNLNERGSGVSGFSAAANSMVAPPSLSAPLKKSMAGALARQAPPAQAKALAAQLGASVAASDPGLVAKSLAASKALAVAATTGHVKPPSAKQTAALARAEKSQANAPLAAGVALDGVVGVARRGGSDQTMGGQPYSSATGEIPGDSYFTAGAEASTAFVGGGAGAIPVGVPNTSQAVPATAYVATALPAVPSGGATAPEFTQTLQASAGGEDVPWFYRSDESLVGSAPSSSSSSAPTTVPRQTKAPKAPKAETGPATRFASPGILEALGGGSGQPASFEEFSQNYTSLVKAGKMKATKASLKAQHGKYVAAVAKLATTLQKKSAAAEAKAAAKKGSGGRSTKAKKPTVARQATSASSTVANAPSSVSGSDFWKD